MNIEKKKRLINLIKNRPKNHDEKLKEIKEKSIQIKKRDDILRYLLIQSFSTHGGSKGWEGMFGANEKNYKKILFSKLLEMPINTQKEYIAKVLADSKIRYHNKKTVSIVEAFNKIKDEYESPREAWKYIQDKSMREKMNFMQSFNGIGPKYSRNIRMDICDDEFQNTIAIDSRIKIIAGILEIKENDYIKIEDIFLQIAQKSGINGRYMDRLLYNFMEYYKNGLYTV